MTQYSWGVQNYSLCLHKRVYFQVPANSIPEQNMNVEELRTYCLGLPHTTEDIKWGNDLCFLVGDKMFATTSLNAASGFNCSFKCSPEKFASLVEREGITSAPYTGRFG